jgi:DNA-binding transcriptional LysR family regulator
MARKAPTTKTAAPPRTDWRLFEYFRVAGRLQHITRAAKELGTSQPALSRALKRLEADIGIPMFERAGRAIKLTRSGQLFLRRVESALYEIDQGRQELADLASPESGLVSLGFLRTLGVQYVPQLVKRFRTAYPGVRISFLQSNGATLAEKLKNGELDLIFTSTPIEAPPYKWKRVEDQELFLIVPRSHRLAGRKTVALKEAAQEPFVSFRQGHAMRRLTDDLCNAAGFAPSFSFEGDDSSSVPGFVAAGFGVAIMPVESGVFPGVSSVRISKPAAHRTIGIGWVEERFLPASARRLRDFALSSS